MCVCVQVTYLSGPLQVAKVHVWDKEHGLSLQVGHGLEVGGVRLLRYSYHADASIFPWTPEKRRVGKNIFSKQK